jgi:hypothetical protein
MNRAVPALTSSAHSFAKIQDSKDGSFGRCIRCPTVINCVEKLVGRVGVDKEIVSCGAPGEE